MNYVQKKRWLKDWAERQKPPVPIPTGFKVDVNKCGKSCKKLIADCQRRARIPVASEFDDKTIWLIAPLNERIVMVARKEIGAKEWPAGSNWGPEAKEYLASVGITFPTAWCASFVTFCLKKAGYRGSLPDKPAWVPAWVNWAKARGKIVPVKQARRGDLIVVDWNEDSLHDPDHIGIITRKSLLTTEYATIEGNVGDGGEVARRTRKFYQTAAVIRL